MDPNITNDSDEESNDEPTNSISYLETVEEESESEPEIECDVWDNDCRIVETKPSNLIGYHMKPTSNAATSPVVEQPPKRQKLSPSIRSQLQSDHFIENFQQHWSNNSEFLIDNDRTEFIVDPFKLCIINNFLDSTNLLNDLCREMNEIEWNTRHMDLYEFFQSKDLKYLTEHTTIECFYDFLKNDVLPWISKLTGFELTNISATCSCYTNTDYLLVHDDQREDRMIAFVLYLTPQNGWSEADGGALQMLNSDIKGQPNEVVRNILPSFNQFIFFPVANNSYHQVAEVTSLTNCRLSINGWFHTKISPTFETPSYTPYPNGLYSQHYRPQIKIDLELNSWINEEYLNCENINDIQKYFEDNSEICLRNFLTPNCFTEIVNILCSNKDLEWIKIGPPNRHNYEILKLNNLPDILDRFLKLFQSKQMFSLLQRFTDLDLGTKKARMKFELQKWRPGYYSLLSDYDWQKKELDLLLYIGCENNSDVIGARTQYITMEDEIQNALITIDPEENHLNIIYRDTARFTKYFSKQSVCNSFYTLICSYLE